MSVGRPAIDLRGRRFGDLTAIAPDTPTPGGALRWRFGCSCGGEITVDGAAVRRGRYQHCSSPVHRPPKPPREPKPRRSLLIDLTGQTFGQLRVLQRGDDRRNETTWLCLCACGRETTILSKSLRCGETRSCGCRRGSLGAKLGYLPPPPAAS